MNDTNHSQSLAHVPPQRRAFLARFIAGSLAVPAMTSVALAQPPGGFGGKGAGGFNGKGKGGSGLQGKGGLAGKGRMTGSADPAALAARLLQEFDKDGDQALNVRELTAALKSLSERRGMMGGAGKGNGGLAGKGKGNGTGGFAGKGKGSGGFAGKGNSPSSGSVKPKRPEK